MFRFISFLLYILEIIDVIEREGFCIFVICAKIVFIIVVIEPRLTEEAATQILEYRGFRNAYFNAPAKIFNFDYVRRSNDVQILF